MLCAFGLATIFVPGKVGFVFDGVGAYSASVFFYEKQYKKTKDIDDLYVVVRKVDVENDSVRAERLFEEIITHADFSKLCKRIDDENKADFEATNLTNMSYISTRNYCYGSYCMALIENGQVDKAKTYANEITDTVVFGAVSSKIQSAIAD